MSLEKKLGSMALAAWLTVTWPVGPVAAEGIAPKNPLASPDPVAGKGEMASQKEIDLLGQKEIEIVNQRFREFLSAEGIYSDKNLKGISFMTYSQSFIDLGLIQIDDGLFNVQSVSLHHEEKDGDQYLALGIKNKKGERGIIAAKWPISSFFELAPNILIGKDLGYKSTGRRLYSQEEVDAFLDEEHERMYNLRFFYKEPTPESNYTKKELLIKLYESDFRSTINDGNKLLSGLFVSMDKKDISNEGNDVLGSLASSKLAEVNTYQEFVDLINTGDNLPTACELIYKDR